MTNKASVDLIVLWENELRKASVLLAAARDENDKEKLPGMMMAAYAACEVALEGLTEDKAVVMLGNKDLHDAAKARRDRRSDQSTPPHQAET